MSRQHENGQAQARQALEDAFERQNAPAKIAGHIEENASVCRNPGEYDWCYIGKRDMLVPFKITTGTGEKIRLEQHAVWIVEGRLHAGESNLLVLRRFFVDTENWLILLGEGYDRAGTLVNYYMLHKAGGHRGRWYAA